MKSKQLREPDNISFIRSNLYKYIILGVLGPLIIFVCSLFQHPTIPVEQNDLSHLLNYNFTTPVAIIFFIAGLLIGYFLRLNPLYAGISLFSVFPLTSIIEILIDRDSHNLLPFEFIMYFLYALPSIIAVFIGRVIFKKQVVRKKRVYDKSQIEKGTADDGKSSLEEEQ